MNKKVKLTLIYLAASAAITATALGFHSCQSNDEEPIVDTTPVETTQITTATDPKPAPSKPASSKPAVPSKVDPKKETYYNIYKDEVVNLENMVVVNLDEYPMHGTIHIVNTPNNEAAYYKDIEEPSTKYANFQCGTHTLQGNTIAADDNDWRYLEIASSKLCPTCFNTQSEIKAFNNKNYDLVME